LEPILIFLRLYHQIHKQFCNVSRLNISTLY